LGADAFPSPNFGSRREGAQPSLIVLHYTGMDSHAAALARLCDPAAEVSAHYLLDMDGTVTALVDEVNRAWHAGAGTWGAVSDVNSHSIGIEMTNSGSHPFSERQMAALETLLVGIMARWSIPPQGVIAHSDMAPSRKRDPGRSGQNCATRRLTCLLPRLRAPLAIRTYPSRTCSPRSGCGSGPGRRGRWTAWRQYWPMIWRGASQLTQASLPRKSPLARMAG
jgi:N-acetylmuramoyl-L-alanine amidase